MIERGTPQEEITCSQRDPEHQKKSPKRTVFRESRRRRQRARPLEETAAVCQAFTWVLFPAVAFGFYGIIAPALAFGARVAFTTIYTLIAATKTASLFFEYASLPPCCEGKLDCCLLRAFENNTDVLDQKGVLNHEASDVFLLLEQQGVTFFSAWITSAIDPRDPHVMHKSKFKKTESADGRDGERVLQPALLLHGSWLSALSFRRGRVPSLRPRVRLLFANFPRRYTRIVRQSVSSVFIYIYENSARARTRTHAAASR